jgi:2-amino-4-hydroxy-6-hydroxymethyldihydropteridine diphosphokinase
VARALTARLPLARALVGLGSNLGDRAGAVRAAAVALSRTPGIRLLMRAPLYVTRPVGYRAQPWFVNSAVLLETTLGPARLVGRFKRVEAALGRRARRKNGSRIGNGPREIDIDLLLLGDRVHAGRGVTVPHARFHERAFALVPAADIAGGMRHPVLGMGISSLARRAPVGRAGIRRLRRGEA